MQSIIFRKIEAETGRFHVVRQSGSESTPMALNDYLTLIPPLKSTSINQIQIDRQSKSQLLILKQANDSMILMDDLNFRMNPIDLSTKSNLATVFQPLCHDHCDYLTLVHSCPLNLIPMLLPNLQFDDDLL